jgi:hypothetical protein
MMCFPRIMNATFVGVGITEEKRKTDVSNRKQA